MLEVYKTIESYLIRSNGELNVLGKLLKVFFFLFILKYIKRLINSFIDNALKNKKVKEDSLDSRRMDTIGNMLKNIIRVTLYFFFALMVLEMFNIDTKSILATAGIGGVAIGFGAQSLVTDIINGFFILQENLYVVGDHVEIQGLEGIVEELGLRTTKIRGFAGDLYTIPNGEVKLITNRSRGAIRALTVISIAYEESIDRAISVLTDVCEEIKQEYSQDIITGPQVDGVDSLADHGIDIRITGMIKSGEQWKIERALRKKAKEALERENIEIPYPRLVVYNGEE